MVSKRRFFVALKSNSNVGDEVSLNREDSHHLAGVLRASPGDIIALTDRNSSKRYEGTIVKIGDEVVVELTAKLESDSSLSWVKTLICALSKGDSTEWMIEKCTELCVQEFILWPSERSVVKIADSDIAKKESRFLKIAESAAKQSNRSTIPNIKILSGIKQVLNLATSGESLICSLTSNSRDLKTMKAPSSGFNMAIGPEGGFTSQEEEAFIKSGFIPILLGPSILRAETAAVAAVAMVNGIWGFRETDDDREG